MKVIDINLKVTSQQYSDILKAERVDLHLNVAGEIGDTIELYKDNVIKSLIRKVQPQGAE